MVFPMVEEKQKNISCLTLSFDLKNQSNLSPRCRLFLESIKLCVDMQITRWRNILSINNHIISSLLQFSAFHSTPCSNQIQFSSRQKHASAKKSLKSLLYISGSSKGQPKADRRFGTKSQKKTKNNKYKDSASCHVGSSSDRTILGLPPTGPLKIEDVKIAFRLSALKWHPDMHQGPSQAMAQEKFKLCVNAYETLCNALSPA